MDDQPMEGDARGWLSMPLFKAPERPMRVGDTWTETRLDTTTDTDPTRPFSYIQIDDSKSTYTVLGEETKMGFSCLHLRIETTVTRQSQRRMGDTEVISEGELEWKGHVWFACKEGLLVELSRTDFYEGTTAYSGPMNMTSPNTEETKLSIRLVKYLPAKK